MMRNRPFALLFVPLLVMPFFLDSLPSLEVLFGRLGAISGEGVLAAVGIAALIASIVVSARSGRELEG